MIQKLAQGLMLLVVALFVIGLLTRGHENSSGPTQAVIMASQRQPLPSEQATLTDIVDKYALAYQYAANDMLKGGTRAQRAKAICDSMPRLDAKDWIGTVTKLSSNADGNGVLAVQIAKSVTLKTWNNDFSDLSDHTLIQHDSPLYVAASQLSEGVSVAFSGSFFRDKTDCIKEISISVSGAMQDPEFLFRFTAIRALQ